MAEPVRLAVIGAGKHTRLMLLPALHFVPGLRLMRMATRTQASADRAHADFRVPVDVGAEAILADEAVEAVLISVPGKEAAALSVKAIRAGKHVFCETPAMTTESDAASIEDALSTNRLVYQVGYCLRYAPIYQKLQEQLIDWRQASDGPRCLDIRYYEWIHHFYNLALHLCGPVKGVHALGRGHSQRITLEFETGDLGTIRSTYFHNHGIPYEEVEITAADGMLRATDRHVLEVYREEASVSPFEMRFGQVAGKTWRQPTSLSYNQLSSFHVSGYAQELEAFTACVRTGATPLSGLEDARQTMQLSQRIRQALQTMP